MYRCDKKKIFSQRPRSNSRSSAPTSAWHLHWVTQEVTVLFSSCMASGPWRLTTEQQQRGGCDDWLLGLLGHSSSPVRLQSPLWETLQPNASHVIVPLLWLSVCTVTLVAPRQLATPCQTQWRQLPASILVLLTAKWTEAESGWGQLRGAVQNLQHGGQKTAAHNRAVCFHSSSH